MAHSLIIQLSEKRLKKGEHITIFDLCEDPVLQAHCDWAGAEGNFADCATEVSEQLRPVCFINRGRCTLQFKSNKTLRKRYIHALSSVLKEVSESLYGKRIGLEALRTHSEITQAIDRVYDVSRYLFVYEDECGMTGCRTLSQLVLDRLNGVLPSKLYIGGVLDYHF